MFQSTFCLFMLNTNLKALYIPITDLILTVNEIFLPLLCLVLSV